MGGGGGGEEEKGEERGEAFEGGKGERKKLRKGAKSGRGAQRVE